MTNEYLASLKKNGFNIDKLTDEEHMILELASTRPRTPDELHDYVRLFFNVNIPRRKICEGCCAPFDVFCAAYFAEAPMIILWASRGCGKTLSMALLSMVEQLTLGATVILLGGSGEQAKRLIAYLRGGYAHTAGTLWDADMAPKFLIDHSVERKDISKLYNGGTIEALLASVKSVRGKRGQRLRIDEIDCCDLQLLEDSLGIPQSDFKRDIKQQILAGSTYDNPDGSMCEMLRRARDKGWPIFTYCYKEVLVSNGGWLPDEDIETKKLQVTEETFEREYNNKEPQGQGRIWHPKHIDFMFDKTLGNFRGDVNEVCRIQNPHPELNFYHGADWAQKRDSSVFTSFQRRDDGLPDVMVNWTRMEKMDWKLIIGKYNAIVAEYGGASAHDCCVDDKTEILTKRGWLKYSELTTDDYSLAIEPTTGTADWQKIEYIHIGENKERDMLLMEGAGHSSLTTLDHRWLSYPTFKPTSIFNWKTSETLSRCDRIPTSATVSSIPTKATYSDDFVELMAWYWTEGWCCWSKSRTNSVQGAVSQSESANPVKTARIRALLSRIQPDKNSEYLSKYGVVSFWLRKDLLMELDSLAPGKVISTEFILKLTKKQLDLFIEVSILADGHGRKRGKHTEKALFQKDPKMLDSFLMICALAGKSTSTHLRTWDDWSSFIKPNVTAKRLLEEPTPSYYTSYVLSRQYVKPISAHKKHLANPNKHEGFGFKVDRVKHTGLVWCPHLKNNNWLARRNGYTFYTGNTGIGSVINDLLEKPSTPVDFSQRKLIQDILTEYVIAVENGEIIAPYIEHAYYEHKYATWDQLYGHDHLPDSIASAALAWHVRRKGMFTLLFGRI